MVYGYIYRITHRESGKTYIGQTTWEPHRRWTVHKSFARTKAKRDCPYLHAAIRKHGEESFEMVVLASCESREELNVREREEIVRHGSLAPAGYNIQLGGQLAGKHSSETRARMSAIHTGRVHGPEWRANQSDAVRRKRASIQATLEWRTSAAMRMVQGWVYHRGTIEKWRSDSVWAHPTRHTPINRYIHDRFMGSEAARQMSRKGVAVAKARRYKAGFRPKAPKPRPLLSRVPEVLEPLLFETPATRRCTACRFLLEVAAFPNDSGRHKATRCRLCMKRLRLAKAS